MSEFQKSHQNEQPARGRRAQAARKPPQTAVNPEQFRENHAALRSQDVLAAQQQVGNQAVQRALDGASRRRQAADESGNLNQDISDAIQKKRGGGSALPEDLRRDAEERLGSDFSGVRLHTDEEADHLSRSVSARAFTVGQDIFFKRGVYTPGARAGRETLIHELTHVIQQSGSKSSGRLKLGAPDTALEHEADRLGKRHAASAPGSASGAVQKQEEEEVQSQPVEEEELQAQAEEEEELQAQASEEDELQA